MTGSGSSSTAPPLPPLPPFIGTEPPPPPAPALSGFEPPSLHATPTTTAQAAAMIRLKQTRIVLGTAGHGGLIPRGQVHAALHAEIVELAVGVGEAVAPPILVRRF